MNPAPIMIAFTPAGLDYVFKLLMARPWGEVNGLVADIQTQVQQQQNPQKTGVMAAAVPGPGLTDED